MDYGGSPIWEMAGYLFERELAAAGVARWVDLVRVRQGHIAWLGYLTDFSKRYGVERQQRLGWAQRVRAAHGRLMRVVQADPNAKALRQAYMAALTQDAGGEQALREGGGQTNQLLSEEGFPLEAEMVESSLRDGWILHSISWMCGRPAGGRAGTPASIGCAGRASRTTNERSHGSGAPTFSPPAQTGGRRRGRSAGGGWT